MVSGEPIRGMLPSEENVTTPKSGATLEPAREVEGHERVAKWWRLTYQRHTPEIRKCHPHPNPSSSKNRTIHFYRAVEPFPLTVAMTLVHVGFHDLLVIPAGGLERWAETTVFVELL